MKSFFKPFLVNEPKKDPALYIELFGRKESFIVDLGDISNLSNKRILSISRVFVTHTHIDHFYGFDRLLRVSLSKKTPIHIYGPAKITKNVSGKLSGYTWNLIKEYPITIYVNEIAKNAIKTTLFSSKNFLKPEKISQRAIENNIIYEDGELIVKSAILEHKIPVLAFYFEEKCRVNVRKDMLTELNLKPGSWLTKLKNIAKGLEKEDFVEIDIDGNKQNIQTSYLVEKLLMFRNGEKILYATDFQFSKKNVNKIKKICLNPDILFCESFFKNEDEKRAKDRFHLTSAQTEEIARIIDAKKLVTFHFSPRYKKINKKLRKR